MVQGVGFRYRAQRKAESLSITGWVRNLDDGDVEVWAEGDPESLRDFQAWLEEGPPGAVVRQFQLREIPASGRYSAFSIEF